MSSEALEVTEQKMSGSKFLSEGTESIFVPESVMHSNLDGFPGNQPVFPGNKPVFPSHQPVFPGNKPVFPINQPILHSNQSVFPANQPLFPSNQTAFLSNQALFPSSQSTLSSNHLNLNSMSDLDSQNTGSDLGRTTSQIKTEQDAVLPKNEEHTNHIKKEPGISGSPGANIFITESDNDLDSRNEPMSFGLTSDLDSRNEPMSFGFTSVKEEPQDEDDRCKSQSKDFSVKRENLDIGLNPGMPMNIEPQMPLLKSNSAIGILLQFEL